MIFVDPINPTKDEIMEWAFEPGSTYPVEDFALIISSELTNKKLILELASNKKCPHRLFFLRCLYLLVGDLVKSEKLQTKLAEINELLELAKVSSDEEIVKWKERTLDLMADPNSFKYGLWCNGGWLVHLMMLSPEFKPRNSSSRVVKISPEQKEIVRQFEKALVDRNYQSVSQEVGMGRVTASEIENAIKEYGGNITTAPDDVFYDLEIIHVMNTDLPTWAIDFDLWIDDKRSDLTLQLTIVQNKDGSLKGMLDDFHTL